jgi:hypothetical protein
MKACDRGEELQEINKIYVVSKEEHTHGNAIGFRVICLVVILVNGILANNESSTDGKRETMTVGHSSKDLVNMVHC